MVTGQYPAVSMTFVDRELRALRQMGWKVQCFSLTRATVQQPLGAFQKREAAQTVVLRNGILSPLQMASALSIAVSRPKSLVKTIGLALQMRPPGVSGAIRQLKYVLAALHLALRLREIGAVHIHNHLGDASGTVAALASQLTGLPFSMTLHGPEIFQQADYWHLRKKIALSAFTVCISHYCRAQAAMCSNSEDWEKLRIIHCGIEPDSYSPVTSPPRRNRLLFVGRLEPRKGVAHLLEALRNVRSENKLVELTVIGAGSERAKLEAIVRSYGLTACVRFAGAGDEKQVALALRDHDVLVVPSLSEGLPVVIMEAMASARPVVVSAIAAIPELVRESQTGKLVPPGDPASLAAAIKDILNDERLRELCVKNARVEVLRRHDAFQNARVLSYLIAAEFTRSTPKQYTRIN